MVGGVIILKKKREKKRGGGDLLVIDDTKGSVESMKLIGENLRVSRDIFKVGIWVRVRGRVGLATV